MSSITIVNKTNAPLNSSLWWDGVNWSWRNKIDQNEFFVHSAGPGVLYNLYTRFYTGRESLYESNWGELAAEVVMDLIAAGLAVATMGVSAEATTALYTLRALSAASTASRRTYDLVKFISLTNDAKDAVLRGVAGDAIIVATGSLDVSVGAEGSTGRATANAIKLERIDRRTFDQMRRNNEIYEMSKRFHRIHLDAQGHRYYVDPSSGRHIHNPDGQEYYYVGDNHHNQKKTFLRNAAAAGEPPGKVTWGKAMTGNDAGEWKTQVFVNEKGAGGFEVLDQGNYGVINARLLGSNGQETKWTCGNMGDNKPTSYAVPTGEIVKVETCEQYGYGIVDMRFTFVSADGDGQHESGWLTGNPATTEKNDKVHFASFHVPAGSVLVGMQGREQGGYGLVDIRFATMAKAK